MNNTNDDNSNNNNNNNFLSNTKEKANFNQYWYSANTISTIVREIEMIPGMKVACLSTPSIYFSLNDRSNCKLFDVLFHY